MMVLLINAAGQIEQYPSAYFSPAMEMWQRMGYRVIRFAPAIQRFQEFSMEKGWEDIHEKKGTP